MPLPYQACLRTLGIEHAPAIVVSTVPSGASLSAVMPLPFLRVAVMSVCLYRRQEGRLLGARVLLHTSNKHAVPKPTLSLTRSFLEKQRPVVRFTQTLDLLRPRKFHFFSHMAFPPPKRCYTFTRAIHTSDISWLANSAMWCTLSRRGNVPLTCTNNLLSSGHRHSKR